MEKNRLGGHYHKNHAFKGMEITNDNHKETGTTDHGVVKATFEYRPI